jgi:hypothetical protein
VRAFQNVQEIVNISQYGQLNHDIFDNLYTESIAIKLEEERRLEAEILTLGALETGELKPSGGIIRHRGKELVGITVLDASTRALPEDIKITAKAA